MAWEPPFLDGFDHYTTSDLTKKYTTAGSNSSISTAQSRTGNQSLRLDGSLGPTRKIFAGKQYRTFVLGTAFYSTWSGSGTVSLIFLERDGSAQLRVRLDGASRLLVLERGTTVIATGSVTISESTWMHLGIDAYIDATNGWAKVYVDGVLDIDFSGNTQQLADNFCNGFALNGGNASFYDDLYARGSTTLETGGFFGDSKVLTRMPTGPGSAAQLTSSSGNPNWQNVNTALPDLTTYNHSLTPGNKDLYDFAALNDPGAILAVQVNLLADKSDAGLRLIVPRIKSGATEEAGAAQALSIDERYHTLSWEVDPATGATWEHAALDNAEFGAGADD